MSDKPNNHTVSSFAQLKAYSPFFKNWFNKRSMTMFRSVVETRLLSGMLFITSERHQAEADKLYTVRQACLEQNSINVIGGTRYRTLTSARAALDEHRMVEDEKGAN